MADAELEQYFARLAADAGTPTLTGSEANDVLDLAKVVAHTAERKYAPVACYAAGLMIDVNADSAQRAASVRAVLQAARSLGANGPSDG